MVFFLITFFNSAFLGRMDGVHEASTYLHFLWSLVIFIPHLSFNLHCWGSLVAWAGSVVNL